MSQHDGVLDNASGSAFRTDLNNFLLAILSNSSGASAPSTTYAYMWWHDTTNGILKQRDAANSAWLSVFKVTASGIVPYIEGVAQDHAETSISDGDTTPSASSTRRLVTANTSSTSISDFDGHTTGQDLWLRVNDANTILVHGSGVLELIAGHNVVAQSGDVWHFRDFSGVWKQLPDGIGMGRPGMRMLSSPDTIGDWGAASTTALSTVDLSDDSVPKGARAALIEATMYSSSVAATATFRANGAGAAHSTKLVPLSSEQNFEAPQFWVPLDKDAKLQMQFNNAWTASTNTGKVLGYLV